MAEPIYRADPMQALAAHERLCAARWERLADALERLEQAVDRLEARMWLAATALAGSASAGIAAVIWVKLSG